MNSSLMETMLARGVGLNPAFFERAAGASKFPPHDIIQLDQETYRLRLAVAGFTRDDLKVTLRGEMLTVIGHKVMRPMDETNDADTRALHTRKMLYQGIANRDFTSEFMIGENVQIMNARLQDGLLDIDLVRQIPEVQRLKEIPILA